MKKIRIDNIECQKYTRSKVDKPFYEFIKWVDNLDYGKKQFYLDQGYTYSFGGEYLVKDGKQIDHNCFADKEYCYTIATLRKGETWYLESISDRLLDLSEDELVTFWKIYKLANSKLNK